MTDTATVSADQQVGVLGVRPMIHHIALSVFDLDQMVAWYTAKLGFRQRWRMQRPATVMMEYGDISIELMWKPDTGKNPDAFVPFNGAANNRGYVHGSFRVDDALESMRALVERGVTVQKHPFLEMMEGMRTPGGLAWDLELAWFWDLEGNLFQLWSGDIQPGVMAGRPPMRVMPL